MARYTHIGGILFAELKQRSKGIDFCLKSILQYYKNIAREMMVAVKESGYAFQKKSVFRCCFVFLA